MKKIILVMIAVISVTVIFFACKKEAKEKTENPCPVVDASAVPQIVKDSFALRYPATNVITWFNKNNVSFCAYFKTSANMEKLVQFANNGSFIREELETEQEGQHEDSTATGVKVNGGCECETHKEGD